MDSSREAGTLLFSFLLCFYSQWPVLLVTAVFSELLRPSEVKPKEGAKADRCGRIDLQVPAPPQEDTALHGGAIDGRGINPRCGSVTCC